jgi:rubrerythrin
MQPQITLGSNRTGLKASPIDSDELLEALSLQETTPAPETSADAIRSAYLHEAEAVGSMPAPTTAKGVVGSVAQTLTGKRLHVFLDKLGERAAYERSGTRLYDQMLRRAAEFDLPEGMTVGRLQEIRDEEAQHFMLVSEAIEQLGGDPTTQTPCADVSAVQGMGLMQAMSDPRITLAQALQTLLAAELIDNASWELLIELADEFRQDELRDRFQAALAAEEKHLERVQTWLRGAVEMEASVSATH